MLKNDFELLKNVFEWLKMLNNVKKANAGPTDQPTNCPTDQRSDL